MKFSETKLNQFTIVPYEGFELYIKNIEIIRHYVNTEAGYYIWDDHRKQRMDEVVIYKRIFDDNGELLDEPLYDIHEYYVCNDKDNYKEKIANPYENETIIY